MRLIKLTSPWRDFDFTKLGGPNTACVFRTGAFGDLMQASTLFPALKEQGFAVTVVAGEYGIDVIRNDPHVDTLFLQPRDALQNEELGEYWAILSKRFTRWVNLSESVERSLLAIEGDKCFDWPKDFRDLVLSVDYLDAAHAIAGCLGFPKRPKFYRTAAEMRWAKDVRRKLGMGNKVILFPLSGSGLHKAWPHMDQMIARLFIEHPDVRIVFTGDAFCKILEYPWRNEPRILCKSDKWQIRDTLSFMPEADLVLGVETGVLNAAAFEPMPKILLQSHSNAKNVGESWVNTISMEPENTPCYPCHKMHWTWKTCNRDEATGLALCMANISADRVYDAVVKGLYE